MPADGVWLSLVEHLLWEQKVAGSNPVTPTTSAAGPAYIGTLATSPALAAKPTGPPASCTHHCSSRS